MHYAYIRQQYGLAFYPGDGVVHTETGREGIVVEPRGREHYVSVDFGDSEPGYSHPHSLECTYRGALWEAAQVLNEMTE